jgi:hypothetical protein
VADPLVDNASDVKQIKAARKRERFTLREKRAKWSEVSSTFDGMDVLWEILEQCGIYRGGFTGERAHFNEGQRNVGLYIIAKINDANPNALFEMMTRAKRKEKSDG